MAASLAVSASNTTRHTRDVRRQFENLLSQYCAWDLNRPLAINRFEVRIPITRMSQSGSKKYRYVFTSKEDQILHRCVERLGTNDWELIALQLPGRSARQCRERWFTYLSPDVNRTPWSAAEDALLFDLMQTHGPRWGAMVPFFCKRTQNNIKNRWNTVLRKAKILGFEPTNRKEFIETGQKIASRSTQTTFDHPEHVPPPSPQQLYSLGNLLNCRR
jgi:hypothetical protein